MRKGQEVERLPEKYSSPKAKFGWAEHTDLCGAEPWVGVCLCPEPHSSESH